MKRNLPKITIVGRPNVGKSSIYNRIIGKKESIIHNRPGVTRDRNYSTVSHRKYNFLITDTGGIEKETIKDIPKHIKDKYLRYNNSRIVQSLVKEQVNISIREASLILFVIEIKDILPDDYFIAELLRKSSKQTILVVNKTDNDTMKNGNVYELGFEKTIFVSAMHGRNISGLLDSITQNIEKVTEETKEKEDTKAINVAIIGKPNSGKSSLLNKILGKNRSIVSELAGTTRDAVKDSIFTKDTLFNFLDTAGIRRRSKVEDDVEYYSVNRAVKSMTASDITIHLIDAEEGITEQDKKIIGIAVDRGKAIIIAINKWDLLGKNPNFKEYIEKLRFKFAIGNYIPITNISALNGAGIGKLLNMVKNIYGEYKKNINTTELNKVFQEAQKKHNTSGKRAALKIYYGTQVSSAPPRFILFVNKKELLTKNYTDYLINTLRKSFGFLGTPIFIHARKSD